MCATRMGLEGKPASFRARAAPSSYSTSHGQELLPTGTHSLAASLASNRSNSVKTKSKPQLLSGRSDMMEISSVVSCTKLWRGVFGREAEVPYPGSCWSTAKAVVSAPEQAASGACSGSAGPRLRARQL